MVAVQVMERAVTRHALRVDASGSERQSRTCPCRVALRRSRRLELSLTLPRPRLGLPLPVEAQPATLSARPESCWMTL